MADESTAQGDTGAVESAAATPPEGGDAGAVTTEGQGTEDRGGQEAGTAEGGEGKEGEQGGEAVSYGDFDYSAYPEGFEMNEETTAAFKDIGTRHNIPAEAMQELVAMDAARYAALQDQMVQSQQDAVAEWADEVKNDPEIGGTKLEETLSVATKAINQFGDEGFKDFLNQTGLGNHPSMVRTFHAIGKAISEDQLLTGKEPVSEKTTAEKLYPSMTKK